MNSSNNSEFELFANQESADFFFHFTKKREHLVNIMNNYFMPFYCMESLEHLNSKELPMVEGQAYPVVCFCDLPLYRMEKHKNKFGEYGIGLKKEWGIKNYLTSVVYSHTKSINSASLRLLIKTVHKLENEINNGDMPQCEILENELKNLKRGISLLMMHYKPYEGKQYNKDLFLFDEKITRLYDEREWRYIPLKVDGLLLSLTIDEYQIKETLDTENEKIQQNNKLYFELNDIEYLFLKNEDEIEPFLFQLKSKYSEEQIVEIKKKIQPFKKLHNMFTEFPTNPDTNNLLAFKVADEITRMRQRIASMPFDINGISQLSKSLDRLEEELNVLGFELPVLINQTYDDGMTVKARFIPSESMKAGERIITKVIKPQINYKGQLVQIAEVEVSTGD